MLFFPLIIAIAMLALGASVLRQNPRRPTNQVLAAVCFVSVIILALQLVARIYGARYLTDRVSNPMPWVRVRLSFIGLLCPLMVWMCYYVVSGRFTTWKNLALKLAPWAAVSAFLIVIPFTESFKPSESRPDNLLEGPLYTVYLIVILACLSALCVASIAVARRLVGIRRLEFQFITIAFGYLSFAIIAAALINVLLPGIPFLIVTVKTLSFLVFLAFGISAWSVTSRRIYHSSQIVLPLAERFTALAAMAIPTFYVLRWLPEFDYSPWAAIAVIASACAGFYYLDDWIRGRLNLKSEQRAHVVAKQLLSASDKEIDPQNLMRRFEPILAEITHGSRVRILTPDQDQFEREDFALTAQELRDTPLLDEGWLSVASLARMPRRNASENLRLRLERERIHVLVIARWSENEPGMIIAFGERENGAPFTYPEVRMLRSFAETVDGLYTRCRFSLQARQAEQLAAIGLIGAGLAHELRNPIVAINTFAQLLPNHLDDSQFLKDFAEVIPGEARRIQALAEQLLDLSRPRKYEFTAVDLHGVIADTLFLLKAKAGDAKIALCAETGAEHHHVLADAEALRQVFLNLVLNAIQSIGALGRHGKITVRTLHGDRRVIIEIEDDAPGVPEHIRRRLFRPFASAGKEGGMGLGLAICAEIVRVHHGDIWAENRDVGALFRVSLPTAIDNTTRVSAPPQLRGRTASDGDARATLGVHS